MGPVGACGDNAAMESFFSLLQKMFSIDNDGKPERRGLQSRNLSYGDLGSAAYNALTCLLTIFVLRHIRSHGNSTTNAVALMPRACT